MGTTGTRTRLDVASAPEWRAPPRYRLLERFPGVVASLCCAAFVFAPPAAAETWRFQPYASIDETWTSNVNLDPTRRSDFVTTLTPGFRVEEIGAHSQLTGSVALPALWYARTGGENNAVRPEVGVFGKLELAERLLFVEGAISVSQQYLTPFGARPNDLTTQTRNQYTSQVYRISPYIQGSAGNDLSYEIRDNNIWTKGNASVVNDSYVNEIVANLTRGPRPFGWGFDYDRNDTKYKNQSPFIMEIVRARGLYQIDPQVELSATVGFEHNDFLITDQDNVTYGGSIRWRPSDRTSVDASYEHRFFGGSYNVAFNNRTPLSLWSVAASRNITTTPQQLAALPGGINVQAALNQILVSQIPDPLARQNAINQLIADRGLPSQLLGPITLYTQQVTLQETTSASAGLIGARNSLLFSLYRQRNEPIAGSGTVLPPALSALQNNTQSGGNVVWSHSLTPQLSLTSSVDGLRTVDNTQAGTSKQASVRATLNSSLSTLTSAYAGVRYQIFRSTISNDYEEFAVFVGLTHRFN